ncbi:amidase [Anaerotruncus sp. AF02-27]|uniref:amidase domain-containing protein n=1 Tax=Anaerotruncus TaxID=244127 RepID=UPI000E4DC527|nr:MULTISPECIES: amidase domain-containing protein [Anaerotruncus]RGX55966.1 amidase [Anaerotruncus sp. AF02-27]
MPTINAYERSKAAAYAERWAFSRNPRYLSFDGIGGDCTSFISQCIYAGSGIMNYKKDVGWYYNSVTDRAAAWSGVPYLYKFLTANKGAGPFASLSGPEGMQLGDVIQLGDANGKWYHSLLVTGVTDSGLLVSTHTYDAHLRPLSSYIYAQARFLHIEGVRRW